MNPLFSALFGTKQGQNPLPQGGTGIPAPQGFDGYMGQLQADPGGMLKQAGYSVPDEMTGDPQAMAMHLLRTGQIGGPAMQRIQPMLRMLTGR